MTIVAGFKSHEGVVLCADTQETIDQVSKHNVPKLRVEPSESSYRVQRVMGEGSDDDLAVAFCGATDNGPYLDMVIDKAWEAAREAVSLAEACASIEDSIKHTHREYGDIYQTGYLPSTEIIYGGRMEGDSKLFYSLGPAITERKGFVAGGVGVHLANFIASRMYSEYLEVKQCVILAAYILFQTKEHVDGCGGDSQIAVLRAHGTSGQVHWENVESITKLLRDSDKEFGEVLMHYADHKLTKDEFLTKAHETLDLLATTRDFELENFRKSTALWDSMFGMGSPIKDELGLPTPPTPGWPTDNEGDEPK